MGIGITPEMKMIRALFILAMVFVVSSANAASICEDYLIKSNELGCDSTNYLTAYGYRYCAAFEKRQPSFTPSGQTVLSHLRFCLLDALSKAQVTCDSVEAFAFESHVSCYVESGFCEMNSLDKMHILWMIRDQVATPNFAEVGAAVAAECVRGQ
jgi:hypothetical protein